METKLRLIRFLCRFPSLFARTQLHRKNPDTSQLAFLSLVEKGQTVFDIGANFGSYTRLFSGIVGENSGRVFAFEPVTDSMNRLRLAVEGLNNVTLVQQGLGSVPNKSQVFIPMETWDSRHLSDMIVDHGHLIPVVEKRQLISLRSTCLSLQTEFMP